ncbi:MAG: aminotransferase [Lachnospiraceae bacterium]|nr:aminotransferase [Lachnospiraceae bacterium]
MKKYKEMTKEELKKEYDSLNRRYRDVCKSGIHLDMSRGKPSIEQLDLSRGLLDTLYADADLNAEDGMDVRNYGGLLGIPEARRLMGDIMGGVPVEKVIACGNASLNIMYDCVSRAYSHGIMGNTPWHELKEVKFLCPVPGYDRHFKITEYFGIEMINIPMLEDGPDMDKVREYVEKDPDVKGIWCVPKYSNPEGTVYSDDVVRQFAALEPAAPDFRIFWDNAYCVHHLYEDSALQAEIPDIIAECEKAGHPDMVYEFCSTSKISFAGSGLAAIATSVANIEDIRKGFSVQTIGYDKVNQLRHVHYFKDIEGVKKKMMEHASILRPKFESVENALEEGLAGLDIGTWTKPKGGYFISFYSMDGCAKEIVRKCAVAGVKLTGAGATYPYGKDPRDRNIRIAPSFPTTDELKQATELFVLCVKLVSLEKTLESLG